MENRAAQQQTKALIRVTSTEDFQNQASTGGHKRGSKSLRIKLQMAQKRNNAYQDGTGLLNTVSPNRGDKLSRATINEDLIGLETFDPTPPQKPLPQQQKNKPTKLKIGL